MSLLEKHLERYVMFLREIGRYPDHYKKIVIRTRTIDKDTDCIKKYDSDGIKFEGVEISKYDYVWNILASFIKWDVDFLTEDDEEIWFFFHNDSEIGKEKFVYMSCYKSEWEAEEAK